MASSAGVTRELYLAGHNPRRAAFARYHDVLRGLAARALLVFDEVVWLLRGGYAGGAHARGRTLHELCMSIGAVPPVRLRNLAEGPSLWSDNETEIDLLGFDYLVDELLVALTNPSLLPLTVGLLGEWGSGKSSLLSITKKALDESDAPSYLTVSFSPWQHEDYEDVKLALMRAVLDRCEEVLGDTPRIRGLKTFLRRVGSIGRRVVRVGTKAGAAAAGAAIAAADPGTFDPSIAVALPAAASALADVIDDDMKKEGAGHDDKYTVASLDDFRTKFGLLVAELDAAAVVVFIDDLDRCLPNSVVDTFEAIRLFLNSPKTAFVVAVHRRLAEAAIDAAFIDYLRINGEGLGHDYLEKMLQIQLSVPRLSDDDAASYVGLLLARLHLSDEDFDPLLAAVSSRRSEIHFGRTFDLAFAGKELGDKLHAELKADLDWAEEVIPFVNGVLRANPRQIKRFLNDMRLRQHAAKRRKVELVPSILAKLLALYEVDFDAFQRLFDWQVRAAGPIPELASAEAAASSSQLAKPPPKAETVVQSAPAKTKAVAIKSDELAKLAVELAPGVAEWAARPAVKKWLGVAPRLGTDDLRKYFTYFRSRLIVATQVSRLAAPLQAVISKLISEVAGTRRAGADDFAALEGDAQLEVWEAIVASLRDRPESAWWGAAAEVAGRSKDFGSSLIGVLESLPEALLPAAQVPAMAVRLPAGKEKEALLARWSASTNAKLSTVARIAAAGKGT